LVSVDFFAVPTATFRVLYVFLVLAHERRRVLHFNITDSPSARWAAQQLAEAFPFSHSPRYVLRDRDSIYGLEFQARAGSLGLEQKLIAPRSPVAESFRGAPELRQEMHLVCSSGSKLRPCPFSRC
jgi:putative transposase